MTEFEFLKRLFQRLVDAERIEREMKPYTPKGHVCNHGAAAIACIIEDYLELRKGQP